MKAYHAQAAIAAVHAGAERVGLAEWERILSLYDDLVRLNPSPVIFFGQFNGRAHTRARAPDSAA